jgi:hypothetical protein
MSLTVSAVRDALIDVVAQGDDESKFLPLLNQVQDRYFSMGRWQDMQVMVDYPTHYGYITLPRRAESVLGVLQLDTPLAIFGRLQEFNMNGLGANPDAYSVQFLADIGDRYPVMVDIPASSFLKVTSSATEHNGVGLTVAVESGSGPVFTKPETLKIPATGVATTQQFTKITRVTKPVTKGYITLTAVNAETAVETVLAVYEPGELSPSYRRYKMVGRDPVQIDAIRVICKRKFVPCIADTDIVVPPSIGALKHGLLALNYENNGDIERANASWQLGLQILQGALREERGGAMILAKKMQLGVGKIRSAM